MKGCPFLNTLLFYTKAVSKGVIFYRAGKQLPLPDLDPPPRDPSFPSWLKFNFFQNLVKTKINLHNSSINRHR